MAVLTGDGPDIVFDEYFVLFGFHLGKFVRVIHDVGHILERVCAERGVRKLVVGNRSEKYRV